MNFTKLLLPGIGAAALVGTVAGGVYYSAAANKDEKKEKTPIIADLIFKDSSVNKEFLSFDKYCYFKHTENIKGTCNINNIDEKTISDLKLTNKQGNINSLQTNKLFYLNVSDELLEQLSKSKTNILEIKDENLLKASFRLEYKKENNEWAKLNKKSVLLVSTNQTNNIETNPICKIQEIEYSDCLIYDITLDSTTKSADIKDIHSSNTLSTGQFVSKKYYKMSINLPTRIPAMSSNTSIKIKSNNSIESTLDVNYDVTNSENLIGKTSTFIATAWNIQQIDTNVQTGGNCSFGNSNNQYLCKIKKIGNTNSELNIGQTYKDINGFSNLSLPITSTETISAEADKNSYFLISLENDLKMDISGIGNINFTTTNSPQHTVKFVNATPFVQTLNSSENKQNIFLDIQEDKTDILIVAKKAETISDSATSELISSSNKQFKCKFNFSTQDNANNSFEDTTCEIYEVGFDTTNKTKELNLSSSDFNSSNQIKQKAKITSNNYFLLKVKNYKTKELVFDGSKTVDLISTATADNNKIHAKLSLLGKINKNEKMGKSNLVVGKIKNIASQPSSANTAFECKLKSSTQQLSDCDLYKFSSQPQNQQSINISNLTTPPTSTDILQDNYLAIDLKNNYYFVNSEDKTISVSMKSSEGQTSTKYFDIVFEKSSFGTVSGDSKEVIFI